MTWKPEPVTRDNADEALPASDKAGCMSLARRLHDATDRFFNLPVSAHWTGGTFRTHVPAGIEPFAGTLDSAIPARGIDACVAHIFDRRNTRCRTRSMRCRLKVNVNEAIIAL
jgi:hypothetical protein